MTKEEQHQLVMRKLDLEKDLAINKQEIALFESEIARINYRLAHEAVAEYVRGHTKEKGDVCR